MKVGLSSLGTRMVAGFQEMVPGAGLEPARLAAGDFESPESTNFTTRAVIGGSALWHSAGAFQIAATWQQRLASALQTV